MPFIVKIPEEAEALLLELEKKYSRAAAGIRMLWGQEEAEDFIEELICYRDGFDREGFDLQYLKIINSLKEIHYKDYLENLNPRERADKLSKEDVWHKAYTYVEPKKKRPKPTEK